MSINTICNRANLLILSDRSFIIPENGEDSETLMNDSNDYITSISGCDYSYRIVMADGSITPDHYSIDQATGRITFTNKASRTVDEFIGIVIDAMDDYNNPYDYQTDYFRVESECGVSSTTVIPPTQNGVVLAMDG